MAREMHVTMREARPVEGVGPAWGTEEAREHALALAREDRPSGVGVHSSAPYDVPGAPPELRALVGELVGWEQHRRNMAARGAAIDAGDPNPTRPRNQGVDADLRELALEQLEATPLGADLRRVGWRWLRWAAFEAPGSCARTLADMPSAGLALSRAREILDELIARGPAAVTPGAWSALHSAFDRPVSDTVGLNEHNAALWTLRHSLWADARLSSAGFGWSARCWCSQGGDALEGLRQLAALLAAAPAWPVEVSA